MNDIDPLKDLPAEKPSRPSRASRDTSRPRLPGVRWIGTSTLSHTGPQAAILQHAVARDVLEAVYKKLPPGARQNLLVAKKWRVWGVLATPDWITIHGRGNKPPKPTAETPRRGEEKADPLSVSAPRR